MAERSRSISQKWYSISAFTKIYKQLITKCHHKKFSASKISISKGGDHPKSPKHEDQKEHDEINENEGKGKNGIIRATSISSSKSSPREIIKNQIVNERNYYYIVGSPPPSPSMSKSPNLNSSRFISKSPQLRSSSSSSLSRRRNPSPLKKSSSRNYDSKINMSLNSGGSFLSPSPLSRNRSTGTRLLRNISKRNNNNNNNNNNNIDSPTHGGGGGNSPFTRSVSQRSSNLIMYSNSNGVVKPPTLEETLECTLEELCFGCIKKIKSTRDAIANDGQILEEHEEVFTIKVQPGWRNGTKITFEGMMGKGIVSNSNCATDITFTVAEQQHNIFKREGNNDLELSMEISLVEALTGCTVQIPLLSGEKMSLSINDVIKPGYRKIISGQGMTIPHDNDYNCNHDQQEQGGKQQRGNLIIKFLVKFPIQLTKQQCSEIIRILKHST